MKKIGILTFHNAENYGAVLQAYALKTFIKKIKAGYQVDIIDYKSPYITLTYKYIKPFSFFKTNGVRKLISYCLQFIYLPKKISVKKVFNDFDKKFLISKCDNLDAYDTIIYGSDQIWSLKLTNFDFIYLGENYNGKKISYAASDGGDLLLDDKNLKLLNSFYKISCREKSLTLRLQNKLKGKCLKTVCDPVFLLKKDEWLSFARKPKIGNYVLIYKIAESLKLEEEAVNFAKKHGKKVLQITYIKSIKKIFCFNQKFISAITPNEFVGYFAYADFIFTTSFHGTAFSIILEKDFYTLSFKKRSERITDLLNELNLTNRFVEQVPKFNNINEYKIDYSIVEDKRNKYINNSVSFLEGALNEQ